MTISMGRTIEGKNHLAFRHIDNEQSAYWLGFLWADGNILDSRPRIQLGLGVEDAAHVVRFRDYISPNSKVCTRGDGSASLAIDSSRIYSDLKHHGFVPRKSYADMLDVPCPHPPVARHFWRGVIDGDGCIHQRNTGGWVIQLTGHPDTIEAFGRWLDEQDIKHGGPSQDGKIHTMGVFGVAALHLASILYSDCQTYLPRKRAKVLEMMQWASTYIHGNAKLTLADMVAINEMYGDGMTQQEIADEYGVSKETIYNVRHGITLKTEQAVARFYIAVREAEE